MPIRVFDAAFNQVGSAISSTQPIVVAGLSPDGQRLLTVAGNVLRIFNTTGGGLTEITPGTFIDIGAPPITALTFSSNSRTAFVTTRFQRLTAVDDSPTAGGVCAAQQLDRFLGGIEFLAINLGGSLEVLLSVLRHVLSPQW